MHRTLATDTCLFKIGITDDKRCTFCKTSDESIVHPFHECHVTQFLLWVKNLVKTKCSCRRLGFF